MLIDIRIYQTSPGSREEHLALFEEFGLVPQSRLLGSPYMFSKSIEDPNEFILVWSYDNSQDRKEKREKMWSDPEWNRYVTLSKKLGAVTSQCNKIHEIV